MANPDGPWVRFFASDWLAGTRGMTAAETGVYITLVATMYENSGPIVREDARLARRCGLPTRNFAVILDRLIADEKITLEGENLWGRKVDMEVRNRSARAEKARAAALAKAERNQRPISARAPAKQAPSSAPEVLRARASEPEPDSKDEESLEAAQPKARAKRLPADWSPSDADKDWLRSKWVGIGSTTYSAELEKFRNYWLAKSGRDATKLDWSRTWQNWMMTAMERTGTARPPPARRESVSDVGRQLIEEIEHAERQNAGDGNQSPHGQHRIAFQR